jgi:hypothetical protein
MARQVRPLRNGEEASVIVHFVGFKSETDIRFWNAIQVFGYPDFVHRVWDVRAKAEVMEGDLVVFAKGTFDQPVKEHSYDDSANQ